MKSLCSVDVLYLVFSTASAEDNIRNPRLRSGISYIGSNAQSLAERDFILEKMKLIPTRNMAAYLRKIAIDGYIIQIDHSDIKAMTAEIQKIGVNLQD